MNFSCFQLFVGITAWAVGKCRATAIKSHDGDEPKGTSINYRNVDFYFDSILFLFGLFCLIFLDHSPLCSCKAKSKSAQKQIKIHVKLIYRSPPKCVIHARKGGSSTNSQ